MLLAFSGKINTSTMYSTTVYLFQQITRVLMLDSSGQYFTARYDPVYAKKLTVNKGVDNVLLFTFVNQNEKPVNVTGCNFTFRILDQRGTAILVEEPMVILNGCSGQVKVTIPALDLLEVRAQPASYSIQVQSGNLTQAVFTNAQSGARAPVDIVDSVLPYFVPSAELTIPTVALSAQYSYDGSPYQNYPDWAGQFSNGSPSNLFNYQNPEYFSSHFAPTGPVTTIQMDLVGYTGTIKAQAAQNYQSIWYNVTESTTYYNETKTIYMNVIGYYPLLRLAFNNSIYATPFQPSRPAQAAPVCVDGQVTQVILQNPGSGYLAPPKINFIGDGSGATAEAIMAPNVFNLTITNPGFGYDTPPEVRFIGPGQAPEATCTINSSGGVDSITITKQGYGYTSPPTIAFIGDCVTPAAATCQVNTSGTIQSIVVTNPGSGYWPVPSGGPNSAAIPIPPPNQGALCSISTGYIVNLMYR